MPTPWPRLETRTISLGLAKAKSLDFAAILTLGFHPASGGPRMCASCFGRRILAPPVSSETKVPVAPPNCTDGIPLAIPRTCIFFQAIHSTVCSDRLDLSLVYAPASNKATPRSRGGVARDTESSTRTATTYPEGTGFLLSVTPAASHKGRYTGAREVTYL